MVILLNEKTIWAEHYEHCSVANYLQHCIKPTELEGWKVVMVLPNTPEMKEYKKMQERERSQSARNKA